MNHISSVRLEIHSGIDALLGDSKGYYPQFPSRRFPLHTDVAAAFLPRKVHLDRAEVVVRRLPMYKEERLFRRLIRTIKRKEKQTTWRQFLIKGFSGKDEEDFVLFPDEKRPLVRILRYGQGVPVEPGIPDRRANMTDLGRVSKLLNQLQSS